MNTLDALPRLHHVGFVVADIEAGMPAFCHSMSATWDGRIFEDPQQGVKVAFLAVRPGEAQIELVQPAGEPSPVMHFLQDKGGGMHHLCYEVADLDRSLAAWKGRGAIIAKRPKPAVAFDGRRIAWILTAEKVLIEFLEREIES
ncbi:MAG: VOC family protein [Acidobacteriota bacterium]|nr:VOC family protein [Acidobacteriota bacterium]